MFLSKGWKQFDVFTEIESLELYLRSIELKQCKNGVEQPPRLLRFVTFVHLLFSVGSRHSIHSCVFMKGTSCCVIRRILN